MLKMSMRRPSIQKQNTMDLARLDGDKTSNNEARDLMNRRSQPNPDNRKLAVASSKFATRKSHLPPVKNVGSKKLLPGNSVMQNNFLEEKADFH